MLSFPALRPSCPLCRIDRRDLLMASAPEAQPISGQSANDDIDSSSPAVTSVDTTNPVAVAATSEPADPTGGTGIPIEKDLTSIRTNDNPVKAPGLNNTNDTAASAPITFSPDPLDMGEMSAGVAKTSTVTLTNTSDEPVTITKAIPGCGCTTLGWPKDPIAPGESADIEITLKPGPKQGIRLRKRVTFQIEGHPSQILNVEGDVALRDHRPRSSPPMSRRPS